MLVQREHCKRIMVMAFLAKLILLQYISGVGVGCGIDGGGSVTFSTACSGLARLLLFSLTGWRGLAN